jgi:hypothetical protein
VALDLPVAIIQRLEVRGRRIVGKTSGCHVASRGSMSMPSIVLDRAQQPLPQIKKLAGGGTVRRLETPTGAAEQHRKCY